MTHQEMWSAYQALVPSDKPYEAWSFGQSPDDLANLVLQGIKTATCSARLWYEGPEAEPLPQPGSFSVILDSQDRAVCIIRTTRVYTVPFSQVSPDHAQKEGEGDRSLAYWQRVHEDFFRAELAPPGLNFTPDMSVVCEEFEVVYPTSPSLSRE